MMARLTAHHDDCLASQFTCTIILKLHSDFMVYVSLARRNVW